VPQIPLWEEKYYFSPGNLGFPVFRTKFAAHRHADLLDNFFPEGSRILALKGPRSSFSPHGRSFCFAKKMGNGDFHPCISNGLFIFRVNRVGSEEKTGLLTGGHSAFPRKGNSSGACRDARGIVLVEADLKRSIQTRKEWPFFRDRRPENTRDIEDR